MVDRDDGSRRGLLVLSVLVGNNGDGVAGIVCIGWQQWGWSLVVDYDGGHYW